MEEGNVIIAAKLLPGRNSSNLLSQPQKEKPKGGKTGPTRLTARGWAANAT